MLRQGSRGAGRGGEGKEVATGGEYKRVESIRESGGGGGGRRRIEITR